MNIRKWMGVKSPTKQDNKAAKLRDKLVIIQHEFNRLGERWPDGPVKFSNDDDPVSSWSEARINAACEAILQLARDINDLYLTPAENNA
jgi:hypothetical protein